MVILKLPVLYNNVEFLQFFKMISSETEIYIDDDSMDSILKLKNEKIKVGLSDSSEFEKYSELMESLKGIQKDKELITATEKYIRLQPSKSIRELKLNNLSKNDCDIIRKWVILKIQSMESIEVKTCQLCSPSSPSNRRKKLNSLSNKINSLDYFCEVTCEIFKDYSIGVVIWTDLFSDRKSFKNEYLKNNIYIYQTTSGNWKYSNTNY